MTLREPAPVVGTSSRYASSVDVWAHGEYRAPATTTAFERLDGRVTVDGTDAFPADIGRYHLYGSRRDRRSHRIAIVRSLVGLEHAVTMSYVDEHRDGRGWAFREASGPDPLHGFTLLRQAYEMAAPGYAGDISVPVLWDRHTNRIVSNVEDDIARDLAVNFSTMTASPHDLYPSDSRSAIDALEDRVARLDRAVVRTFYLGDARDEVATRLAVFERVLRGRCYLLGNSLTLADVRLWVSLLRYDLGVNACGGAGPPLSQYGRLRRYASELYTRSAFYENTELGAIAAPLTDLTAWTATAQHGPPPLSSVARCS